MFKKYLKTMAGALILALVVTMFVPLEPVEAASNLSQPAIYTDRIVVNINPNFYTGNVQNTYLDVRVNNGSYMRIDSCRGKTPSVEITNISPINTYDIKVSYDYVSYGKTYTRYDTLSKAAMAPVQVTGLRQTNWYCYISALNVDWTRQQSVTGYQYELYNNKNALVATAVKPSYYSAYENFNKLASATHRMRVRAYTTFNGVTTYGAWSDWLEIVPPLKKLTGRSSGKRKVTLKWSKVKGATSYTVYVSTKRTTGYKKTKTVSAKKKKVTINRAQCVGCDVCVQVCPKDAIGKED